MPDRLTDAVVDIATQLRRIADAHTTDVAANPDAPTTHGDDRLSRMVARSAAKDAAEAIDARLAAERRADIAEIELRTLRTGLRAIGADPTQIQNLWAQIHLRNKQWAETKREARALRRMLDGDDANLVDEMLATVEQQLARASAAEEQRDQLAAAVERVRTLHVRNANTGECEHCSERDYPDYAVPHPCPTAEALAGPGPDAR